MVLDLYEDLAYAWRSLQARAHFGFDFFTVKASAGSVRGPRVCTALVAGVHV